MKLTYHRCGDYLLPALTIPDEPVALGVPSSIMRKFIYNSGRTQSAQGRETCP